VSTSWNRFYTYGSDRCDWCNGKPKENDRPRKRPDIDRFYLKQYEFSGSDLFCSARCARQWVRRY
jgi:hypothetical protein